MSDTKLLATMTGLSEAQIAREASKLVDLKGGKIAELARLDAWLLRTQQGANAKTMDAFQALATTAVEAHPMEEVSHAFHRGAGSSGYPTAAAPVKMGPDVGAALERAAKEGAHRTQMSELAFHAASTTGARGFTASTGANATFPTNALPSPAGADLSAQQGELDADSKSLMFEQLKDQMQKISQMNEMILNVYAAMHEQGMTAIRNVKA